MNTEEMMQFEEDFSSSFWNNDELMRMIESDFERLNAMAGKTYSLRDEQITVEGMIFPGFDEAEFVCRLSDEIRINIPIAMMNEAILID